MSNIGTLLQQKRIAKGLTIDQVGEYLNIRPLYLSAIEEDLSTPDMPPAVYMLGYLKMYANFLGMNGQAITEQLKSSAGDSQEVYYYNPYLDDNRPSNKVLLLALLLICVVGFSWYFISKKENPFINDQLVTYQDLATLDLGSKLYKDFEVKNILSKNNVIASQNKIIFFASQNAGVKILNPEENIWHNLVVVAGNFYIIQPHMQVLAPSENIIKIISNNS